MDQRLPAFEFTVEVFVDPSSVRDVVRGPFFSPSLSLALSRSSSPLTVPGILHTIFFHRFFPSVLPRTRDVLDLTLPYIDDAELETLIDQRTAALVRQLEAEKTASISAAGAAAAVAGPSRGGGSSSGGRGQIAVQFFEKRRRKAWYLRGGEEEVCWESWTVKVTVAEPRTESGEFAVA